MFILKHLRYVKLNWSDVFIYFLPDEKVFLVYASQLKESQQKRKKTVNMIISLIPARKYDSVIFKNIRPYRILCTFSVEITKVEKKVKTGSVGRFNETIFSYSRNMSRRCFLI